MDHSRVQQQPITSGLTNFSSLLSATTPVSGWGCGYARDDFSHLQNPRGSTTDNIEQVFARFVASIGNHNSNSNLGNFPMNQQIQENPTSHMNARLNFIVPKQEATQRLVRHRSSDYSLVSQMNYQNQSLQFISPVKMEPETLKQSTDHASASQMNYQSHAQQVEKSRAPTDNSFVFANSASLTPGSGGGNSNLTHHNSSPVGFFAQINIESEYGAMQGVRSYGTGTNTATGTSLSTPRSFKTQVGFSSGKPPASPRLRAPISEFRDKVFEENNTGNEHENNKSCITDFPMPSREDSHILSDDFLKAEDIEIEPFSNEDASYNETSEGLARPPIPLSHHLSLPTSTMEKLLQDSVHLNVRAKRVCATHPRSIVERVRRTRISDRMRKLQELVPNMDKRTNTADMLDFAANYIKDLEKQVKILAERRFKCTCINK